MAQPNLSAVSPSGTLTYTVTAGPINPCGPEGQLSYQQYTYSSFNYQNNGSNYPLTGGLVYYNSPGSSQGYPPSGIPSTPISLDASSYGAGCDITINSQEGGTYYTQTLTCPAPGVQGFIGPKYKVVGIVYTVPGQQSYVQYTNTTLMGTSTSTSSSFSQNLSTSESFCAQFGGGVCGTNGGSITGTYTNSFTEQSDTSSSYAVNQSVSFVDQWYPLTGPGIDHGNDVVNVWVNPILWYTVSSTTGPAPVQWNGYSYDETDDSNNMEVIPLRVSQLLNPSTIDTYTQGRLLRAWAQPNTDGSSTAITDQDLLNIAALDPFSNPNYTVTIGADGKTTTDGRFTQTTNNEMYYLPGYSNDYAWSYTATTTTGQGAQTDYSSGFSLEEKWNSSAFIAAMSYDFKQSTTFSWADKWNNTTTGMTGQSATVYITDAPDSYTGPNEFNVYEDNVYGTFMVFPVPAQ